MNNFEPKVWHMWLKRQDWCPHVLVGHPAPIHACLCFWRAKGKVCKFLKELNRVQPENPH